MTDPRRIIIELTQDPNDSQVELTDETVEQVRANIEEYVSDFYGADCGVTVRAEEGK